LFGGNEPEFNTFFDVKWPSAARFFSFFDVASAPVCFFWLCCLHKLPEGLYGGVGGAGERRESANAILAAGVIRSGRPSWCATDQPPLEEKTFEVCIAASRGGVTLYVPATEPPAGSHREPRNWPDLALLGCSPAVASFC